MPDTTPSATPIPAHDCPICGGANNCAAARSGSFETPCWCREATFSPDLLARVPEAARGQACICHDCASRAAEPVD
jgi:Cysteine-rich CWC